MFVSGTPPLDLTAGKLVREDIEVQTEASLEAAAPLKVPDARLRKGHGPRVCVELRLLLDDQGWDRRADALINPISMTYSPPTNPLLVLAGREDREALGTGAGALSHEL